MSIEIVAIEPGSTLGTARVFEEPTVARVLRIAGEAPARIVRVPAEGGSLREALSEATARADLVVVVGGHGPGSAGPAAHAAAGVAGVGLVRSREADRLAARRADLVGGRGEEPGDGVLIPEGALALDNPGGPRPGFSMRVGGATVLSVGDEPAEVEGMVEQHVVPLLAARARQSNHVVRLATFGLSADEVTRRLAALDAPDRGLRVEVASRFPEVEVVVTARLARASEAEAAAVEAASAAIARLGPEVVHGPRGETLAAAAANALRARGLTLAVVETVAPGLISRRLGQADPSPPLRLGLSASCVSALALPLGLDPELVSARGAASPTLAAEMAEAARSLSGAGLALATTGIAGPSGGSPDRPLGLVCFALAGPSGARVHERSFGPMARWRIEELTAATALGLVLGYCRGVTT